MAGKHGRDTADGADSSADAENIRVGDDKVDGRSVKGALIAGAHRQVDRRRDA